MFCVFSVCHWLSVPVQSAAWKDSSPKLPIMCINVKCLKKRYVKPDTLSQFTVCVETCRLLNVQEFASKHQDDITYDEAFCDRGDLDAANNSVLDSNIAAVTSHATGEDREDRLSRLSNDDPHLSEQADISADAVEQ